MITVIILTFNNFDQLKKTLQSIQDVKGIQEKIIINGGSCTQTHKLLIELSKDNHYTIVQEKDEGIADAFNKGVCLANGEGVNFLNSGDCLVDPEYYVRANEVLTKQPEVQIIHSNILFQDPLVGEIMMPPRRCALSKGMPFHHQTMVVRRDLFDQYGLFDKNYQCAMDFEWLSRLSLMAQQTHYLPLNAVWMDGDGVSSTREKVSLFECRKALKKNKKWSSVDQFYFYRRVFYYYIRKCFFGFLPSKVVRQIKQALKVKLATRF